MTFTQLRNQVDALCRKYAAELEIYRARPLALEFCDEITNAVTGSDPAPKLAPLKWVQVLLQRFTRRGLRFRSFKGLFDYLQRCLNGLLLPQVNGVLRSLFPKARDRGLIPRSHTQVPFRPGRHWKPGMGYFAQALLDTAKASHARSRNF